MSHYINLYDPALRRQRQWLTAANLLFAVALLFLVLLGWGAWLRVQVAGLTTEEAMLADQTKAAREESVSLATALASHKADPKLELDLAAVKELIGVRQGILTTLGQGQSPASGGYAEYLRSMARQTIAGLWITGFSVGTDQSRMEIRGRTLDPALLPEYIRRLNAEPAFRGHRFAALSVSVPAPAASATTQTVPTGATPASRPTVPAFHEFALVPDLDARLAGGTR